MRWLILWLAAIPAFALWAWIVFVGTSDGWWRDPLAAPGDVSAFVEAVSAEIDASSHGNAAFRLIESGQVAGEHYFSVGEPVDAHTLFQAASLSKWITAWGVMKLVEAGKLDLDAPVQAYLSRWQLPQSPFDNDAVTVRRLLSHTAGLTDELGYQGFEPGTPVQPLEESLSRAADAREGADGRVRVGVEPGSEWRYSGGGYALLQLLIEEVSGRPFESYMAQTVLEPLGLTDSTFGEPADASLATFYDVDETPAPHYRYSATSAASLYTSAADMSRFVQAQFPGGAGEPPGRGVLRPDTLALMRQPEATAFGVEIWGLGHMLYGRNSEDGHVVGHDGNNRPAINTTVRVDPATGDGIVVLVTGNRTLASRLGAEWVFWHTGSLDVATFHEQLGAMFTNITLGWVGIVLAVLVVGWLTNRRRSPAP